MKVKKLLFLFLLLPLSSLGSVNLKNGNFYVKYTDLIMKNDEEPFRFDRTYNSKDFHKGWLGKGWSTEFETFVKKKKDQYILYEYGRNEGRTFAKRGSYFQAYNGEVIHIEKSKMTLVYSDGKKMIFDQKGKLSRIVYPSGYGFSFFYKKNLQKIKDDKGQEVFFEWDSSGYLKKVRGSLKNEATYSYKKSFLDYAVNENKMKAQFFYSSKAQLEKIQEDGREVMSISYSSKTGHVAKVVEGKKTVSYDYKFSPKKKNLYYTLTRTEGKEKSYFTYDTRKRADGSIYVHSILVKMKGSEAQSFYSPSCQLPIKIIDGKKVDEFSYNKDCLLIEKKDEKNQSIKITYEPKLKKMKKVTKGPWVVQYDYNKRGEASSVHDNMGRKVELSYDSFERLSRIRVWEKSKAQPDRLTFTYPNTREKNSFQVRILGVKGKLKAFYKKDGKLVIEGGTKAFRDRVEKSLSTLFTLLGAHQF